MTRMLSGVGRGALLALAVLLLALLLLTACGGDDDGATEDTTRVEMGSTNPDNAPGQTLYLERVTIAAGAELPVHYTRARRSATSKPACSPT